MPGSSRSRSEEHTSELQSQFQLVCRLLLEKKKITAPTFWMVTKNGEAFQSNVIVSSTSDGSLISRTTVMISGRLALYFSFFFNDTATTEIYTLSLHDALPISCSPSAGSGYPGARGAGRSSRSDRKSTRLNSSHSSISYAVFCLKKKKLHLKHQYQKNKKNIKLKTTKIV